MKEGTVIKSTGSWYEVREASGEVTTCRIVGKFRKAELKTTNPLAVGDRVVFRPEADDKGIITEILPRDNYVIRQSPRRKHDLHLIASNIDLAFVIVTIVQPKLKQGFIDRFLLMTEPYDIPTHIVFNKADLYQEEDLAVYAYLEDIYQTIGHHTHLVSAATGAGIDKLQNLMQDKTSLLSGQSGVGKSTLITAIEPTLELRTQELSDYSGKGQHTTTFAEMFPLSFGGFLVDTPGIKTLSYNHFEPKTVAHNFREFFDLSENCRFGGDCLHRNEPGCAVKSALEAETVSILRYENYLTILEEVEAQNYWERNKKY